MTIRFDLVALTLAAALAAPVSAAAMCGCMMPVDDTGVPESTTLESEATQVVLMRHGTTTVQTMQNRYEGPLENFALIVPTPEILSEEQVKTLKPDVFNRIDAASAPRLTEYWQHDPCEQVEGFGSVNSSDDLAAESNNAVEPNSPPRDGGVVVEAEFAVGEYNIQILSADQGTLLETWLNENGYRVPQGASKYLQPYIESGMYFFVAQVDAEKVGFVDEQAVLSPLRFHYDTPSFNLPTRLGMLNSAGRQDLIVYTLGDTRFEAANLANATIPTNVPVAATVKNDFPRFYDELLEETLGAYGPSTAITEFAGPSWVIQEDIMSLGGDVITAMNPEAQVFNSTLSRLHFRYEKDAVGEDIVFATAGGITGGQEAWGERTVDPNLAQQGVTQVQGWNDFKAHFLIKHAWTGAANCDNPVIRWGGNPDENGAQPTVVTALSPNSTGDEVFKLKALGKHVTPVAELIQEDVPEIGLERVVGEKSAPGGCSSTSLDDKALPAAFTLLALGLFGFRRRR